LNRTRFACRRPAPEIAGPKFIAEEIPMPFTMSQACLPVFEIALGPISIASGRRFELRLVDTADGLLAVVLGGSVRTWEGARIAAEPILASSRFDNDHET